MSVSGYKMTNAGFKLFVLAGLLGFAAVGYAAQELNLSEQPDYSETQWRTFYGEKPVDYRPEFWVTYYGARDNEACYKPNVVSAADGISRVSKEIYKEFIAEESDGGKHYVIRYPNQFKLGDCVYSSGGGQLYIEEKSDDPRLNQELYIKKTRIYRFSIARGYNVAIISLASDNQLDELSKGKSYLNKSDFNVFCHKINSESSFKINNKPILLKNVSCSSSSIENGVKKLLAYNSYIDYTINFWRKHPDIKINFKISNKVYCDEDEYCQRVHLPKLGKNVLEPEKFAELYQKGD